MTNLAKYVVALEAQAAQYISELKRANDQLAKFHKDQTTALDDIKDHLKHLAEAYGAFRIADFIKDQIEATVQTAALAKRLDITATSLSELQFAAKSTEIPFESLTTAMQFMARNIAEVSKTANGGSSGAAQALADLHLNARQLVALPLDKQLELVTDALAGVGNRAQAVNDAVELFGRNGAVVLQLAGQLGELRKEAVAAGAVLTEDMVARAEQAQKAMDVLGFKIHILATEAAVAFGPAIVAVIDEFAGHVQSVGFVFDKLAEYVVEFAGIFGDAFYGYKVAIGEVLVLLGKLHDLWFDLVDKMKGQSAAIVNSVLATMGPILGPIAPAIQALAASLTATEDHAMRLGPLFQDMVNEIVAAGTPSEQLRDHLKEIREQAEGAAKAMDFSAMMKEQRALMDAWGKDLESKRPFNKDEWLKSFQGNFNQGIKPISAPPLLAKPGTSTANPYGPEGKFGIGADAQDMIQHGLALDQKKKQDEQYFKFYEQELLKRQRADIDAWGEQMKGEKQVHDMKVQMAFDSTNAVVDLLATLGAKHRGFAMAALLVEKGAAIARTVMHTHEAAMKAVALTGNPAAAIPIWALGAVQIAAIGAAAITGAAQISSAGTSATLGTAANPVFTTSSSTAGGGATQSSHAAVQIIFQGDVFNFRDAVQKIGDELRDLIDNKDVVIIGNGSRQAIQLGGGG